jgi:hypothetical protein
MSKSFDWDENGEVLHAPYFGIERRLCEAFEREMEEARAKAKEAFNAHAALITLEAIDKARVEFTETERGIGIRIQEEFDFVSRVVPLADMVDVLDGDDRVWVRDQFASLLAALDTSPRP